MQGKYVRTWKDHPGSMSPITHHAPLNACLLERKLMGSISPITHHTPRLIIEDVRVELLSFSHWQCSHISKEANTAAHFLAKEAALRFDCDL
jgi:hypothetical protein